MGIHHDLAKFRQLDRAFEPVGVGQQADLHKDAFERHLLRLVGGAILVGQTCDAAAVAIHLGGLGVQDHIHIGQGFQLALQHRVGLQLTGEFQHGDMCHHTRQVDGRLDARVAAPNHRHTFALEQRAVAVRAVGHALGAVLVFTRHVHVAPARTGGEDHGLAAQRGAVVQRDLDQPTLSGRRLECRGTLQVHDVHFVVAHMALQCGGEAGAVGLADRDEVLNVHRVQHLSTKTLSRHTGADAFACGIHGRSRARRATTHDEYVERVLGVELGCVTHTSALVDLGDHLGQLHTTLAKPFTVQEDGGHTHDFAVGDFLLEHTTVNRRVGDARVQHRHQVQRLHHVRAVVAGQ